MVVQSVVTRLVLVQVEALEPISFGDVAELV